MEGCIFFRITKKWCLMIWRENWKIGNQTANFFILFDTFNPHIYFFHHSVKNYFFKGEMIFGENIHPLICVNFSGVNVAVQYHTSTVLKILSLILQGQIDPNRRNLIFFLIVCSWQLIAQLTHNCVQDNSQYILD